MIKAGTGGTLSPRCGTHNIVSPIKSEPAVGEQSMTIRALHQLRSARAVSAAFAALLVGCETDHKTDHKSNVAETAKVVQIRDPAVAPGADVRESKPVTGHTNARVELTDCSAVAVGEKRYTIAVTYRFTAGQPDPLREYAINVQLVGLPFVETKRIPGSQLQKEGELKWEYQLPDTNIMNNPRPKAIKVTFMEQAGSDGKRSHYFGISDEVTGSSIGQ
jgi:hypothetical protein